MTDNNKNTNDYRPRYDGARALVLGATGLIGRWVARYLFASGAELFLPVRDRSSARAVFRRYAFDGTVSDLDLEDEPRVRETIEAVRPDIIFNLAGYGIDRTETSAETAYRINAGLVETICEALAASRNSSRWSGQAVVHVGSAMEYGAISGNLAEDSAPAPTTLYGKSKLAGTLNLARCCRDSGIKGLTARLFAVYGPGESAARLLPSLIRAAGTRVEPIELTEGLHKRDFTYIEDTAEGLLRLGLAPAESGETVNLATGNLISIRDFTETAARVIGLSEERLKFGALPTRPEEMRHDPVTIRRLRELTGWMPATAIAEGVRKTLAFEQSETAARLDLERR